MENIVDIFIIGGGINGTAIAADASGRGLSVALCESGDLASGTSSASTKLIHGGLRYLALYQFGLVKKALNEREVLMKRAPNLIYPLEFILPHNKHSQPSWLIKLGLFLYDHLAKKSLPRSTTINLQKNIRGNALLSSFKKGYSYYDCYTDDARLTILNAVSAKENGAAILTYTTFISAHREGDLWKVRLKKNKSSDQFFCYCKSLINVAGPWVSEVQEKIIDSPHFLKIKLVKGSHIIVPQLYPENFAYLLPHEDGRMIFAIPFEQDFTLIGTTEMVLPFNPIDHPIIEDSEKNYLCQVINHYFKKNITVNDIIGSYSGIRCLQDNKENNPSNITRESLFLLDTTEENTLPLITVIGGKLTMHRILAENIIDKLHPYFPKMRPKWTINKPLPGGDIKDNILSFQKKVKTQFSWLPDTIINRYVKNYGTRLFLILQNATGLTDLGIEFGAGLYQKEIEYLIAQEWAHTAEDILWRRTKLGLHFSQEQVKKLEEWLTTHKLNNKD